MTEQLELLPFTQPRMRTDATIDERFQAFHAANPSVYRSLEHLARQWLAAGNHKVGVKALIEVLRWHYGIQTQGSAWRLNNSLTSRYARLLLDNHPEWTDAIDTRELKAA